MLETVSKSEVLTGEDRALLTYLFPDVKTERGLLNLAYRQRAVGVLIKIPECSWLCDGEKMKAGEAQAWKPTILIELGKILDVEAMISIALQICQIKPKGKQGALMVRNIRLGKNQGDIISLANEVIKAINGYMDRYEMSSESVLEALQVAYQKTEEMRQREGRLHD